MLKAKGTFTFTDSSYISAETYFKVCSTKTFFGILENKTLTITENDNKQQDCLNKVFFFFNVQLVRWLMVMCKRAEKRGTIEFLVFLWWITVL